MAPSGPVAIRMLVRALQEPINQLHYNRRECQQLVDRINAFIASPEEKIYKEDLVDIQQKLIKTLTDLCDVLTDICQQPQLKQILWRDGISILVSRVYEILNDNEVPELDLLRKNEEARSLDVYHFQDVINTSQNHQILKILGVPRDQYSQAIIALNQRIRTIPNDSNPERQFLDRGLRAMQTLQGIPPQDAFSMSEFDIVIYRDRVLGTGGFGEVFEGNWFGTKVAIKRIRNFHPALCENEIKIMKRLQHDHVLQIFGANLNPNHSLLVCALKSQGDVCTFLRYNPSANRLKLCYDVSLGLAYLHENVVIHGDIKPQNILIDENGIPCLCDFGLSRIRTFLTRPPTSPLNEGGMPIGTLRYMSPEQMEYGTTNEASDVYSFGMTIYEIFSDDLPFKDSSNWLSLRLDVVKNAKRPPKPQTLLETQADIDRGLDNTLWSVIEDCWSQEPSHRPTAETVSLRLRDVNGCSVNPVSVQSHTTPKQVQDRNISVNKELSTSGRTGGISTRNQPNVVPPLVKPQNVRNSTESRTAFNDSITTTSTRVEGASGSWLKSPAGRGRSFFTSSQSTKVDTGSTFENDPKMTILSMRNQPVMILLMGEIGAGKSTFINVAAGEPLAEVGHDLDPCTSTVKPFVLQHREYDVVLVDTPGFNHPSKTDGVILKDIINWLNSKPEYSQDMQFGGIIYLHDLSGTRVGSKGNVMTPMKLSNSEITPRVILATIDGKNSMAMHREDQLKNTAWKKLKTQQFTNTKDSALSIVDTILSISPTGIKLCLDELNTICISLPKHLPKRKGTLFGIFRKLFGFF